MDIAACKHAHGLINDGDWVGAANYILGLMGQEGRIANKNQGLQVCRGAFQFLLDSELYLNAATLQWGAEMFNTEPESTVRVFETLQRGSTVLLIGASSMSKCLSPDTNVMMFDGRVVRAQDVKVGDLLMGDDSTPRRVLQRDDGFGPMFRIIPDRGDPWECNDAHILSLRVSSTKKCGNSGKPSKKTAKGLVVDVPISEYLRMGSSRKNILKQFHVGVEFPDKEVPFDPYIYGAWLGDGGTDVPALHSPDGPMVRKWCNYFESIGFRIYEGYHDSTCPMWCARIKHREGNARNPFLSFIRTSVIQDKKEKFIRSEFLINSRRKRLALLAGLIDSDGHVHCKTGYHFTSKFRDLAEQVKWLARSLGLAAVVRPKRCSIKSIGFSAIYWNVQISGEGIEEIPTLEKRAKKSSSIKNLTNTGFKVEPIGDGDYCGFVIDGNHRFLLGDFTVTHNTYAAGAFFLLDYLRDPQATTVKLAAVNEDHLRKNLFAHVATLYRSLAIPSQHEIQVRDSDLWLGVKEAGYEFGISGIAFKQSQETSGQFKGYKAKPVRKVAHPQFGYMSRLRVLGDEGQNWPNGPFKDFNSLIASKSGTELVKIAVAFNPESLAQYVVQLAEPDEGWTIEGLDSLYNWESKAGWSVCRLDAAKCENVIQRKVIYPGLQTYEGYLSYLKAGGDNSPNYLTFARGWPPIKGTVDVVIPPTWPTEARGEATFIETPEDFAGVDLAFMGKDTAQMAIGRWGKASGYRDQAGKFVKFKNRLNITEDKPRYVLQIDQILPLAKHDNVVTMSEEIMGKAKALGLKPENIAIDATGMGFGVSGHLRKVFGEIISVAWNEKATESKITADDLEGADKQCDGVMSEMWWAFRRWLDPACRAILINPIIPTNPLQTQLTSRRYEPNTTKGIKVEKKEKYMARNAQGSPDEADSVMMLLHAVRLRSKVLPGLVEQQDTKQSVNDKSEIKFTSVKKMMGSDAEDSLCASGNDEY